MEMMEQIAREVADELRKEAEWARGRPQRTLPELDAHFDALLDKMEKLALIVADLAAGKA